MSKLLPNVCHQAILPDSCFTALRYQEAQFKKQVLARAGNVAVLCTRDKFNTYAPYTLLPA